MASAPGRGYWASDLSSIMTVLKDWNCWFIEPEGFWFSSTAWRYKAGYAFAQKNLYKIRQHMLLSGNRLSIVAHGKGIAFAEGLAASLYEERGIRTEILVALEGLGPAVSPQQPDAVSARIHFRHRNFSSSRGEETSCYLADVHITEQNLPSGFCRYSFQAGRLVHPLQLGSIYLRGNVPFAARFATNRLRPFHIWTAIAHGQKMIEYARTLRFAPFTGQALKNPLVRFTLHQN
jgi:hypothetical protein